MFSKLHPSDYLLILAGVVALVFFAAGEAKGFDFRDSPDFNNGTFWRASHCAPLDEFASAMERAGFEHFSPGREFNSKLPSNIWFERDGLQIVVSVWTGGGSECVVFVHNSMSFVQ